MVTGYQKKKKDSLELVVVSFVEDWHKFILIYYTFWLASLHRLIGPALNQSSIWSILIQDTMNKST